MDAQTEAIWNVEEREHFFANDLMNLLPPLRQAATYLQVRQIAAARMRRSTAPKRAGAIRFA